MSEKEGFIKLSRKIFRHEFFTEHREYSRAEAWLDLIQLCAFEDANTMMFNHRVVKWGRGQTVASVRFLQTRWGWKSTKRVISFLELLRSQKMIETDTSQGLQRITLCKYEDYNGSGNTRETRQETRKETVKKHVKDCKIDDSTDEGNAKGNSEETQGKQTGNNIKEYKEIEEKNKERGAREKVFYDSIAPFISKYPKEMLRAFYDHWSEWDKGGRKMKWEKQETWEVAKRLATWASREKDFNRRKQAERPPNTTSSQTVDQTLQSIGLK